MKPFTKFVNYKKQKGFEQQAEPASEPVEMLQPVKVPESITRVWGDILSRVEKAAKPALPQAVEAEPSCDTASGGEVQAEPASTAAVMPEAVQAAMEKSAASAAGTSQETLQDAEPNCLDDLFWDLKIDNNRNCLHKW